MNFNDFDFPVLTEEALKQPAKTKQEQAQQQQQQIPIVIPAQPVQTHKVRQIHIQSDRCHNKFITRVQGIQHYGFTIDNKNELKNMEAMCKVFRNKLACAANFHELEKEIIVHGDFCHELAQYFMFVHKMEKKQIDVVNKFNRKGAQNIKW